MKKFFLLTILFVFIIGFETSNPIFAATQSSRIANRATLTNVQIREISSSLDNFNLKIHTKSLFSPEDNEKLFNIKIRLDNSLQAKNNETLAPLYYKTGQIFAEREYFNEAFDCYQTIIEHFPNSIYAQKAKKELTRIAR